MPGNRDALEMILAAAGIEIVCNATQKRRSAKSRWERTVREKITRSKGTLIALSSLIACRGEVSNPPCDDTIDRLGNDAVLKHRLGEIQSHRRR